MIIEGTRFGRLTVLSLYGKTRNYQKIWRCLCDCGAIRNIRTDSLRSGITQSCGCFHREVVTTHGLTNSPEFRVWHGMLDRTLNSTSKDFKNYQGRGITVSSEWATSFEAFYRDMGPRPSAKHTIERIDNNKGYSPENCKWALPLEQHANKRTNVVIEFGGKSLIVSEWSRLLGGTITMVHNRLRNGWSIERALTTPAQCRNRKRETLNGIPT